MPANTSSFSRHHRAHGAKLASGLPAGSASLGCCPHCQMAFGAFEQPQMPRLSALKIGAIE